LIMLVILAVFGSFSVTGTALEQRATSHFDTGNRAFSAAESGILHALSTMNGPGVINFQNDVVNRWGTVFGTSSLSLLSDPTSTYEVTVTADPAAPTEGGTISVTGRGALLARRTLQVNVAKSGFEGGPGAIHIGPDDGVSADFKGNAFDVDGNNYTMLGALAGDGIVKPGITARNEAVAQTVIDALSSSQKDNVRGQGYSADPLTPSVLPVGGPGVDDLDQFVTDLLTLPGTVTTNDGEFNGNQVFGTIAAPQLTYMTDDNVILNGNATGAGILIADGSMTINGDLDFVGLIIVRGNTLINSTTDPVDETTLLGNATILGSLWTGNLEIEVGGSAIIDYCHECLQLVDNIGGAVNTIPRPMSIVSWQEVF
jgi:hypothetical protein